MNLAFVVEEEFHCEEVCSWRSTVVWKVDEVSTDSYAGSVLILFAFTKIAYYPRVRLIALSVIRNVILLDENDGFCGCSKTAYLCPERLRPYFLVLRVLHEMTVLEEVTCLVVKICICEVT